MANVFDVARYILHKGGKMSTWKLQKLCYYAQAWSLVWDDVPLFPQHIEAWANGPVCPALFSIHRNLYSIDESMLSCGDISNLSETELETLNAVLDAYGNHPGYYLREMTHQEAPWQQARGDIPENEPCNHEITQESMQIYYGAL